MKFNFNLYKSRRYCCTQDVVLVIQIEGVEKWAIVREDCDSRFPHVFRPEDEGSWKEIDLGYWLIWFLEQLGPFRPVSVWRSQPGQEWIEVECDRYCSNPFWEQGVLPDEILQELLEVATR